MDQEAPTPITPEIEKRQYRRVKLITELGCEAMGREEVALSRDISVGGMFVTAQTPFPQNSEIALSFRLKSGEPLISCRGKIMHATKGMGMGVMFLDLSEEVRRTLREFVDEAN